MNIDFDFQRFYLTYKEDIHNMFIEKNMINVCDAFFLEGKEYREIADMFNLTIQEVNGRIHSGVAIVKRFREDKRKK